MKTFWAELYRSDEFAVPAKVEAELSKQDELLIFRRDKFGVEEARELRSRLYQSTVGRGNLVVVVGWDNITLEAEQSLLKILEEPPSNVRVILVVPFDTILSPTIISRINVTKVTAEDGGSDDMMHHWLELPVRERFSQIELLIKNKDKNNLKRIRQSLRRYLETQNDKPKEFLETAELVMRYLNKRGASNKMLLEALAIVEPVSKKTV